MNVSQLLNEVLSDTDIALKEYEKDSLNFPLFEWVYNEYGFSPKLVNEHVKEYFLLLLSCQKFESPLIKNIDLKEEEYKLFLDYFFSDVIMSTLNDALNSLIKFFSLKRERKKYPDLVNELFYSFDSFESNIEKYISIYNFTEKDELLDVIGSLRDVIHYKIPKIVFPWYSYALLHTYKYVGAKIKIVREKHLPLYWSRSEYPNEEKIFIESQTDFKAFITSISTNNSCTSTNEYNKSLNLYLFNETTNLYDIYNIISNFKEDSFYMNKERIKPITESINNMNKAERYKQKQKIFQAVGKIAKLNNLGIKTLFIDNYYNYYSETLFDNEEVWDIFIRIFKYCKDTLVKGVKESSNSINNSALENVPQNIRVDYIIYKLFSMEEPFENFIEVALEEGQPPVYTSSTGDLESTHLYEAYAYAYKNFYNSRYRSKKKNR